MSFQLAQAFAHKVGDITRALIVGNSLLEDSLRSFIIISALNNPKNPEKGLNYNKL